ncbi:hypothetical protein ZOSMA_4G00080 [Zostera marina]|uniref:Uncharacterized protein n=1 Tax=Zostera marina TaxID=29655 RepID=A0A0K9NYA5_ZOSMR|nr:hypothetical protein ZOSMA_4G00080 [Zostera marina]
MCCSSSLFFHGGIAATENKTDPIEVEALGAIFRKWKIDGEKTWNISSTNPCTDHVVNDSNDERVNEAVYGKLDILCLCDNNTSVCNIIKLSANDLKISGTIPNELENLTKLVYLYLYRNNFNGSLPSEIGNLKNILTL